MNKIAGYHAANVENPPRSGEQTLAEEALHQKRHCHRGQPQPLAPLPAPRGKDFAITDDFESESTRENTNRFEQIQRMWGPQNKKGLRDGFHPNGSDSFELICGLRSTSWCH
jgi:hypothetical protein